MTTVVEGDQKAPFFNSGWELLISMDCSTLPLIRTLFCWVLSKEVSSTIFKAFGMTRTGMEPRSPGPLANTLPTEPMKKRELAELSTLLYRVKLKESEKKNKYLDLARELKKLLNMKVTIILIFIGLLGTVLIELVQGVKDLEIIGRVGTTQTTEFLRSDENGEGSWGLGNLLPLKLQWKTIS